MVWRLFLYGLKKSLETGYLFSGAHCLFDALRVRLGFKVRLDLGDLILVDFRFSRVLATEFSVYIDGFPPVSLAQKEFGHGLGSDWWAGAVGIGAGHRI